MAEDLENLNTPASGAVNYDESHIKHLDARDHVRARLGMYIGRAGDGSHPDDGIYVLLKEVVDNGVDEFIMNFGRRLDPDSFCSSNFQYPKVRFSGNIQEQTGLLLLTIPV